MPNSCASSVVHNHGLTAIVQPLQDKSVNGSVGLRPGQAGFGNWAGNPFAAAQFFSAASQAHPAAAVQLLTAASQGLVSSSLMPNQSFDGLPSNNDGQALASKVAKVSASERSFCPSPTCWCCCAIAQLPFPVCMCGSCNADYAPR